MSQPSTFASASARCISGSDFGFNMLVGFLCCTPVGAPFARALVALRAMHVIDLPGRVDEEVDQLAQCLFIEDASTRFGRAIHRYRIGYPDREKRSIPVEG